MAAPAAIHRALTPAQIMKRLALAQVLVVANIDSPTELGSIAGANSGECRLVTQAVAGANEWTLYAWDSASSAGVSSPYRVAGTSGQWIAIAGKYANGAANFAGNLSVIGSIRPNGTNGVNSGDATSLVRLSGGTADNGAVLLLGGASHATLPGIGLARVGATNIWQWNSTALTLSSGINLAMSGASTLTTGTGAVSLNGDVTVASAKNLTMSGASTLTTGTGAVTLNGAVTCAASVTMTSGTALTLNDAAGTGGFMSGATAGLVRLSGGPVSDGAGIVLGGSAHASIANTGHLRVATTNVLSWTTSAVTLTSGTSLAMSGASTLTTGTGAVSLNGITSVATTDAVTTGRTIVLSLNHASSGTPAAGFGTEFRLLASSDTAASRIQGTVYGIWVSPTDASRTSRVIFNAADATSTRECLRIESSGSAAMIGFLGAAASIRALMAAATGTATRTTFDTTTVTTAQLAERVKALIDDLRAYGLHG